MRLRRLKTRGGDRRTIPHRSQSLLLAVRHGLRLSLHDGRRDARVGLWRAHFIGVFE